MVPRRGGRAEEARGFSWLVKIPGPEYQLDRLVFHHGFKDAYHTNLTLEIMK